MNVEPKLTVAIVILTYRRKSLILGLIEHVLKLSNCVEKVIVVDNASKEGLESDLAQYKPYIEVNTLSENVGTEGRNIGISQVESDIVVLLDDDVFGLSEAEVELIRERFTKEEKLAALCFKVQRADNDEVINWCHHKPLDEFSDEEFETNEITEGAVAVSRKRFMDAGGFPGHFFISHEGPDLALRLIDRGYEIWYTPQVVVKHHQSTLGRPSWRRYYYDTRNVIWLAQRHYPTWYAFKFLFVQLSAMFVYSLRDGYLRFYAKGIRDALRSSAEQKAYRRKIGKSALKKLNSLYEDDENLYVKARSRLFKRGVDC